MKKITTKIDTRGVFLSLGTPKICDAGDILEILDYPDKGSSLVLIAVKDEDECNYCSVCDMPVCTERNERLCLYTKFRCTSSKTGIYFKRLDTLLEQL